MSVFLKIEVDIFLEGCLMFFFSDKKHGSDSVVKGECEGGWGKVVVFLVLAVVFVKGMVLCRAFLSFMCYRSANGVISEWSRILRLFGC